MPTLNYSVAVSGAGASISRAVPRTSDGVATREVPLPAGKAGTLTTRTDANTGEATLSGGHGITTGMIVDVYWSGGMRYGMTVGTVATNVVPIDGGAGTDLPAAATALVVCQQVQVNADIDGDALSLLAIEAGYDDPSSTAKAHVDMQDVSGASIEAIDLTANTPKVYDITGGATNIFTGNPITKVMSSNGSSSAAATLKLIWGADATP